MDRESAISKNILLALVAAVAIILVVVIAVFIFFPPQPDVVPRLSATVERSGNTVYIYHDGGDPLQSSRTFIRINGQKVPAQSISFLHSQDWPWVPGKTVRVQYDGPGTPDLVEVVYSGSKGEVVVFADRAPSGTQPTIPVTTVETVPVPTTPAPTPAVTGAVTGVTTAPPGPESPAPPQAGFAGEPRTGQVPLIVRFMDMSGGSPTSWLWNFGDGETSTEQNPVHEYKKSGTYTVALTVRNQYGTGQKVEKDYIKAGTLPQAQFAVVPSEGETPLTVQFNDLSTGNPVAFSWDFGDGSGSAEQNPVHTYVKEGEYTVSLTVSNQFGSDTRIQSGAVRVTAAKKMDILLTGSRRGTLSTGFIQFTVTGQPAWIKIAGTRYDFSPGDIVQVFLDRSESAIIDVNANGLTGLKCDSARLFVNGNLARSGIVNDINVPSYSGLSSSLQIEIAPGDATMTLFVDGGRVVSAPDRKILISNLCENSGGQMSLQVIPGALEYRGGARGFSVVQVS
jgi:PKD repeat protein